MNGEWLSTLGVFFNPVVHWFTKLKYLFFIIIILSLIDARMGFSYHYFNQRKMEEVAAISKILNDGNLDEATSIKLEQKRREYIDSKQFSININLSVISFETLLSIGLLHILIILLTPYLLTIGVNKYLPRDMQISQMIGVIGSMIIELVILYLISMYLKNKLMYGWWITVNILMQVFAIYLTFKLANRVNKVPDADR